MKIMDFGKIDREQAVLLLLWSMLGGVAVFAVVVLGPMVGRVADLKSQNRRMQEGIDLVRDFTGNYPDLDVKGRLISLGETSLAMDEIASLANEQGVMFLSVNRQEARKLKGKKSDAVVVQLETLSTYRQLGFFLDGLNALRQSVVFVDAFEILQDKQEASKVKSKTQIRICLKSDAHGKE